MLTCTKQEGRFCRISLKPGQGMGSYLAEYSIVSKRVYSVRQKKIAGTRRLITHARP